jgi:uncharacterized protein
MKFIKNSAGYFGRLEKGEEIVSVLTNFCKTINIINGGISGIGAAQKLKLGYYDIVSKKYIYKDFEGEYEITSLHGNITLLDDEPFIHLHITISDSNFQTFGGHLVSGIVSVTFEFMITKMETQLERKIDLDTGLKLIAF